jgi:hypothetical protein
MHAAARVALVLSALLQAAPAFGGDADALTPTEQRWLAGATPVLGWALRRGLPVDIVVLPAAKPGDAPLALGYTEGRCKLVFAMRGNPAAEATLADIPAAILQATLEAMAAHEIGHCWRHQDGAFSHLPADLHDEPDAIETRQPTAELQALARDMRVSRREEAFADLAGLAWTRQHHPESYDQVLAWFERSRADEPEHGFHDSRHWLKLAHDAQAFMPPGDPFEQAMVLWRRGLANDF